MEFEIKAWADDWETVKNHIDHFAQFSGFYEKSDSYWIVPAEMNPFFPELKSGIRIREESFTNADGKKHRITRVCFKKKEILTNMEVNVEKEFDISNVSTFEELLSNFSLVKGLSKQKKGWSWNYNDITVELSEIKGLGWFCELEIIAEQNDEEFIALSKKRLFEVLKKTGIDASKIETRYYMEMLGERE